MAMLAMLAMLARLVSGKAAKVAKDANISKVANVAELMTSDQRLQNSTVFTRGVLCGLTQAATNPDLPPTHLNMLRFATADGGGG